MKRLHAWRRLLRAALFASLLTAPLARACGPYTLTFYEFGSLYYRDQSGAYVGIDRDVVDELVRRSGCVINGKIDSRVRTWARLADGNLDMSVSGIATPEREEFAHFVPYIVSRNYVLMRKDVAARVPSAQAFLDDPKLRLAVVKSFKHGPGYDEWVEALRAQGRVDDYADAEVVARVFALGRADAFLSQPLVWTPLLKRNDLDGKLATLDWGRGNYFSGLVLSKRRVRAEDVSLLRKTMEAMRKDGTLEAIYRRYLGADVARRLVP